MSRNERRFSQGQELITVGDDTTKLQTAPLDVSKSTIRRDLH